MKKVAPSVEKLRKKQGSKTNRKGDLAPNPEMWAALKEGELLNDILDDFYTQVYVDPQLAHFFKDSTKQRAIEKQYLFLKGIFTGTKCYFGERPRNAHHWMVISNELFDYREKLMEETLRKHHLSEDLIQQWRAVEEIYRMQIVKSEAFGKKVGGVEIPAEGYEEDTLTVGSLCDICNKELAPGSKISYHVRTGKVFCADCKLKI
jgi:truncated hemoglobin YjbI